jgi:hypothetical protein
MSLWLPRNTLKAERETTERRKANTKLLKREERIYVSDTCNGIIISPLSNIWLNYAIWFCLISLYRVYFIAARIIIHAF